MVESCCAIRSWSVYVTNLPIFCMIPSRALGWSYCPSKRKDVLLVNLRKFPARMGVKLIISPQIWQAIRHYLNQFWFSVTNFSENWNEIRTFSLKKLGLKMPSAKWRPFWPVGDELMVRSRCVDLVMSVQQFLNSSPPWRKWPPFCRRYFRMHFREWKILYFC